jgi:hypothetical protein
MHHESEKLRLRGRLHLRFGCAVWVCVLPSHAFSMSFSVLKTLNLHRKRMRRSNAHPKRRCNRPIGKNG